MCGLFVNENEFGKGLSLFPVRDAICVGSEDVFGAAVDGDVLDGVAAFDLVDDVLAFGSLAEDSVLAVEVRSRKVGDEELRAVGIRSRICHREDARLVVATVRLALTLELVAWATSSSAGWATALDHEVRNDAVKLEPVVVAAGSEVKERSYGDGSIIRKGRDVDVAFACVNRDFNIVHASGRIRKRGARVQTEVSSFFERGCLKEG